ncbi:MAG: Gfo/Idh/MocA family oxidoreductase [Eubacteriales bacterium]|nr:Gfo/Idh/MocA family oxidoreductase [Eubacteriales bacterium]
MSKKLKIGVIGVGGIATGVHIPGILNSPDMELVALCDIDEENLKVKAERFGISKTYTNYKDLLADPDVDIVSIATPNNVHMEIAMAAVEAGKPFAVEKPAGVNVEEVERVEKAAREKGVVNMMCFSYRFKPSMRYAQHIIATGQLGKIRQVYIQYFMGRYTHDKPLAPWRWRADIEQAGAGVIADLGAHIYDMCRFLVGDVKEVCADYGIINGMRNKDGVPTMASTDDYANIFGRLEGDIPVSMVTGSHATGRFNHQRVEVYGEKGGLTYLLDNDDMVQGGWDRLELCIGEADCMSHAYHQVEVPVQFKLNQMQGFADICLGKADGLSATLSDGLQAQKVLKAAVDSAQSRQWKTVD